MAIDDPDGTHRPDSDPDAAADKAPSRPDYPDYHDPLAGIGGAPPAYSALTLRLVLSIFGLLVCTVGAIGLGYAGVPIIVIILAALAVSAAVDIAVIVGRKRRGEPG
jgi:Family of unknown function (DUF6343)